MADLQGGSHYSPKRTLLQVCGLLRTMWISQKSVGRRTLLLNKKRYVWRVPNCAFQLNNAMPYVTHEDGIWTCLTASGPGMML